MLLRYIGKDGCRGLVTGQIYDVKVFTRGDSIRVSGMAPGEHHPRYWAYNSPMALAKNWEGVK